MIGTPHNKRIPLDAIEPCPAKTVTRRDAATLVEGASGCRSLHPLFAGKSYTQGIVH